MLDWLSSFTDIIVSIFEFVSHTLETIISVFTTIPRFLSYISSVISIVIPVEIVPFLLIATTFLLMMVIIGRN